MMFTGSVEYDDLSIDNNIIKLNEVCEIQTKNGWKFAKDLVINDIIIFEDKTFGIILNIEKNNNIYRITFTDYYE